MFLSYKGIKICDKESSKECNKEYDVNESKANKNENNAKVMHRTMLYA